LGSHDEHLSGKEPSWLKYIQKKRGKHKKTSKKKNQIKEKPNGTGKLRGSGKKDLKSVENATGNRYRDPSEKT